MDTVPQSQATNQVKEYADSARTALGGQTFTQANENVSNCEGRLGELSDPDEVYYIQGIYQLMVPAEQQVDALRRVRDAWERDGFTIKDDRTFGPGQPGGEVTAVTADDYSLSLTSGQPPAMQLLVSSPCYRNP